VNELHLFAGAGGGILAGQLLGDRCIGAVEIDSYAQSILIARQEDGTLWPFPVFSDIRTFDARPFMGRADVVSGGFPCQDISSAGKRAGIGGARSGLWREFVRVVREVEPVYVRVENSPNITSLGLGNVLGDLAALGFDARWDVLSASDLGAHHLRERFWLVATHADRQRQQQQAEAGNEVGIWSEDGNRHASDSDNNRAERRQQQQARHSETRRTAYPSWPSESGLVRMVHGVPNRLDRIRCLGNAQVPRVAATAWRILTEPA